MKLPLNIPDRLFAKKEGINSRILPPRHQQSVMPDDRIKLLTPKWPQELEKLLFCVVLGEIRFPIPALQSSRRGVKLIDKVCDVVSGTCCSPYGASFSSGVQFRAVFDYLEITGGQLQDIGPCCIGVFNLGSVTTSRHENTLLMFWRNFLVLFVCFIEKTILKKN